MQHYDAADREAHHGSQGSDRQEGGTQAEYVGEDGRHGENQSQYIEPDWSLHPDAGVSAQAQLKQKRGESDRRHDDKRERAEKSVASGIKDYYREREQQESGGEYGPTRRLGSSGRIGSGVGQESVPKLYRGGWRFFNQPLGAT